MSPRRPRSLPPEPVPVEDPARVLHRARRRVGHIGLPLLVLIGMAGWRGVQRIIDPDDRTLASARAHRYRSDVLHGPRGDILAADGTVLATSVLTPQVSVDPTTLRSNVWKRAAARVEAELGRPPTRDEIVARFERDLSEIVRTVAGLLDASVADVDAAVRAPGHFVRLARDVHPAISRRLEALDYLKLGVKVEDAYKRYYPQGTLAGQLLGFVNDDGYGVQGVERFHDDALRGAEVSINEPRSAWLDGKRARVDRDSLRGATVQLTIHPGVQRAAERALEDAVVRHAAVRASAAVIEVGTGRVLALANAPAFNPNRFDGDFQRSDNFAVSGSVEPGSVLKPFTYALALQARVTRPGELLDTTSPWRLHGHSIHDTHPEPRMTSLEMVQKSSNIGAGKLAHRVGADRFMQGLIGFGFGEFSGVETAGERSGTRHPTSGVGPVELATVAFGHGITATPIQLASAAATLGHGGVRIRPWLVASVRDASGVRRVGRPLETGAVVAADVAVEALRAMEAVVDVGGTGTRARVEGYRVGGKTGTAEKPSAQGYDRNAHYATFVGLGPLPDAAIAIAVVVDEPTREGRMGGQVAAPVFADIVAAALPALGIPPTYSPDPDAIVADIPDLAPAGPGPIVVAWEGEAWRLPDLRGRALRDALAGLQGTGITVDVHGAGQIVEQRPVAGAALAPGGRLALRLEAP